MTQEQDVEEEVFEGEPIDLYADSFTLSASPYTVTIHFGIKLGPNATRSVANIRMSPEHAKMMAMLFKRSIKNVEAQFGIVWPIPEPLLAEKNLNLDRDWQ